jgi:hypothetical protein
MNKIICRICILLLGAMVTIAGVKAQTCNGGCNFGSFYYCVSVGPSNCGSNQVCERDACTTVGCSQYNVYFFCVGSGFQCQIPSCSWNVGCGCDN